MFWKKGLLADFPDFVQPLSELFVSSFCHAHTLQDIFVGDMHLGICSSDFTTVTKLLCFIYCKCVGAKKNLENK